MTPTPMQHRICVGLWRYRAGGVTVEQLAARIGIKHESMQKQMGLMLKASGKDGVQGILEWWAKSGEGRNFLSLASAKVPMAEYCAPKRARVHHNR